MREKANFLKIIVKMMGIVVLSSVVGVVLLWLVYLIPRDRIASNIESSDGSIRCQNEDYNMQNGNFYDTYDTDTNIIMMLEVVAPNINGSFRDSLLVPAGDYYANQWGDWADTLSKYAKDDSGDLKYNNYARYWHGYLVILKPLFTFMDLQEIYYLHGMIMVLLTGIIFCLFYKKLKVYAMAYALMIVSMNPIAIAQSFQLSTIWYAMQITLLLLLLVNDKKYVPYIFLIDGLLVAYFDFLTYPMVAFAIPLLTYFLLYKESDFVKNIKSAIELSVSFIIGYAGLWLSKWVYATIFTDENILYDGLINVLRRIGTGNDFGDDKYGMTIGPISAIKINFNAFCTWPTVIISIVFIILLVIIIFKQKRKIKFEVSNFVICLFVAILPFVWYIVLNNHASLHPHIEWRELCVSFFALGVWCISLFKEKKNG